MALLYEAAKAELCCGCAVDSEVQPVTLKLAHNASPTSAQRSIEVSLINMADV